MTYGKQIISWRNRQCAHLIIILCWHRWRAANEVIFISPDQVSVDIHWMVENRFVVCHRLLHLSSFHVINDIFLVAVSGHWLWSFVINTYTLAQSDQYEAFMLCLVKKFIKFMFIKVVLLLSSEMEIFGCVT